MATPHLIAVPNSTDSPADASEARDHGRVAETGAQRIRRLQQEARILAREQVEAFVADLIAMSQLASEIAEGGEAYPVGVREIASRVADEAMQKAQAIITIAGRAS